MRYLLALVFFLATPALQSSQVQEFELAVVVPESLIVARLNSFESYESIFSYSDPVAAAYFRGKAECYEEFYQIIQAMRPKEK